MMLPIRPVRRPLRVAALLVALFSAAACVPRGGPLPADGGRLLPTSSACLQPSDLQDGDGDFRRHPDLFGPDRCVRQRTVREGGRTWVIQTVSNTRMAGPLWVLPHDNEQAAVETAAYALGRYGGTAVLVETGGRRSNGSADPNRWFDAGRSRCSSGAPATRYVAAMLGERRRGAPVIALHTNAAGLGGRSGGGSISIRAPGKNAKAYLGRNASGRLASPDSLVITAVTQGHDAQVAALVDRLTARGVNVMVETTSASTTDCSLSHYAALNGIRPYLNLEVADGDAATQRQMLDIVMAALGR